MSRPKQMAAYDKFEITGEGYILHDDAYLSGDGEETICKNPLSNRRKCAYCSTKLLKVEDEIFQERSRRDYCLWYCQYCRFWEARVYSDPFGECMPPPDHLAYVSKLREFNTRLPDGCSEELAMHIRQDPYRLHFVNPKRFEKFVADVFRANYTNAEVVHVGKPNDGGVDVLLIDAQEEQWIIQVKRRGVKRQSEEVRTIRDMLGAMIVEGVYRGIIVSTAPRFSRWAEQAATKAESGPHRMTLRLVDRGILNRMLDPILPDRPWLLPISEVDQEISKHLANQIPRDNQLDLFTQLI